MRDEYALHSGVQINYAVLIAWVLPVAVGLYLIFMHGLFAAYAVVPCWIVCGILYAVISKLTQKQGTQHFAA